MSTKPLEQAISISHGVLAAVKPEQLTEPTPCADWDVAALINHIVGAQNFFVAGMTGQPPAGMDTDYAAGDYVAAFDEASAKAVATFSEDGALAKMVKLPFGEMPGAAVMGLAMNDTFTHAWDLAKATGQETDLAPELATVLLEQSKAMIQPAFRGPEGAPFGAEQTAPEGASAADQLAAFLGRTV